MIHSNPLVPGCSFWQFTVTTIAMYYTLPDLARLSLAPFRPAVHVVTLSLSVLIDL